MDCITVEIIQSDCIDSDRIVSADTGSFETSVPNVPQLIVKSSIDIKLKSLLMIFSFLLLSDKQKSHNKVVYICLLLSIIHQ